MAGSRGCTRSGARPPLPCLRRTPAASHAEDAALWTSGVRGPGTVAALAAGPTSRRLFISSSNRPQGFTCVQNSGCRACPRHHLHPVRYLRPLVEHPLDCLGALRHGDAPPPPDEALTLAEHDAQARVADAVDHPLGNQEVGRLAQAPDRKRQVMLGRLGLGIFLISRRSGSVKVFGRPPGSRRGCGKPINFSIHPHSPLV